MIFSCAYFIKKSEQFICIIDDKVMGIEGIIYCEVNSNYTNFYFSNRPAICAYKPIHEYETQVSRRIKKYTDDKDERVL